MRFWRIHTYRASNVRLYPVVPAQNTTIPPRFATRHETGNVCSPGCSNTISTSRLPVMSQIALPKRLASFVQVANSGEFTAGIWPQQVNSLRLITPLAPRLRTYSVLDSSEITAIAFAPDAATSCTPNTPRPPEPPHTNTLSPGLRVCGEWPKSMRYAVASVSV